MNLLAHLHLGKGLSPMAAAGNLLADFVPRQISGPFAEGVSLHRRIDSFTDQHPLVVEARELFHGPYRRFAGVLCDFAFDYCLSNDWENWERDAGLDGFVDVQLGRILDTKQPGASQIHAMVTQIHEERWLQGYSKIAGIGNSIARIARRRRVAEGMLGGETAIQQRIDDLRGIFSGFYPELQLFVSVSTAQRPGDSQRFT